MAEINNHKIKRLAVPKILSNSQSRGGNLLTFIINYMKQTVHAAFTYRNWGVYDILESYYVVIFIYKCSNFIDRTCQFEI